jgi:hypothetical protein
VEETMPVNHGYVPPLEEDEEEEEIINQSNQVEEIKKFDGYEELSKTLIKRGEYDEDKEVENHYKNFFTDIDDDENDNHFENNFENDFENDFENNFDTPKNTFFQNTDQDEELSYFPSDRISHDFSNTFNDIEEEEKDDYNSFEYENTYEEEEEEKPFEQPFEQPQIEEKKEEYFYAGEKKEEEEETNFKPTSHREMFGGFDLENLSDLPEPNFETEDEEELNIKHYEPLKYQKKLEEEVSEKEESDFEDSIQKRLERLTNQFDDFDDM